MSPETRYSFTPDHKFLKLHISPQYAQLYKQSLSEIEMNVHNSRLATAETISNKPDHNSEPFDIINCTYKIFINIFLFPRNNLDWFAGTRLVCLTL
jgi:hypothetical protein